MEKIKVVYCGADTALVPIIVLSVLDMLFSMIVVSFLIYMTVMLNKPDDLEQIVLRIDPERTGNLANFMQLTHGEKAMLITIPMTSSVLGFFMGLFLLISALKKSVNGLRIWFILSMIFMIIKITIFITQISAGYNEALFLVSGIFEYIYRIYALWVLRCLIKEINAVNEETSEDTTVEDVGAEPEQETQNDASAVRAP